MKKNTSKRQNDYHNQNETKMLSVWHKIKIPIINVLEGLMEQLDKHLKSDE